MWATRRGGGLESSHERLVADAPRNGPQPVHEIGGFDAASRETREPFEVHTDAAKLALDVEWREGRFVHARFCTRDCGRLTDRA